MATAAKFRIDVAIHDLLMNSNQRPPAPAEAMGLTLPEPVFPRFPDRLKDPGPETPLRSANGVRRMSTAIHEDGWFLTSVLGCYLAISIPSLRIYLSSTNAISIAGTAGRTTTKSKA